MKSEIQEQSKSRNVHIFGIILPSLLIFSFISTIGILLIDIDAIWRNKSLVFLVNLIAIPTGLVRITCDYVVFLFLSKENYCFSIESSTIGVILVYVVILHLIGRLIDKLIYVLLSKPSNS